MYVQPYGAVGVPMGRSAYGMPMGQGYGMPMRQGYGMPSRSYGSRSRAVPFGAGLLTGKLLGRRRGGRH